MERRLIQVAKEFNIGLGTIVEYLHDKGFDIENRPITKVNEAMYEAIAQKFADSKTERQIADTIRLVSPFERKIILTSETSLKPEIIEIIDGKKVFQLWHFIEFNKEWANANTSKIDDIVPSWISKREKLKEDSKEYTDFINKLKREHAIETGVVERLYDLKKGIT